MNGYYEAILQLRPKDEEVLKFVKKQLEKRNDVSVAKIVNLETGTDLYLTSHRFAKSLSNKLKKVFKGTLKVTKKLHTVDRLTSRKIYKITICFRLKPKPEEDELSD